MTPGDIRLISRREIARDLQALDLPPEHIYLVHSSLRRVGTLADGPKTLVDAMLDTCGLRSTLVVPTFTAGNSTTTRESRRRTAGMSGQQLLDEEAKIAGFDLASTASQNVGIISEYLRRRSDAVRSNHPQTSFGAIGPHAEELTRVHELDCHLGEKSPLSWLYDNNAVVLLIGVGFNVCTCFHLAEYRLDGPIHVRPYRTFVMNDGRRDRCDFFAPETDDRDFAHIGAEMATEPFVNMGRVGHAPLYWFPLRSAVDFAVRWMNSHRLRDPAASRLPAETVLPVTSR